MPTRRRLEPEQSRTLILDATERVMLTEGYAAVSTRRVAVEAGMKPPLVHYYYPATDDLLLALFRRMGERLRERIEEALASEHPIRALWEMNVHPRHAALAAEAMALANHRKAIRTELARQVTLNREMQAQAFARAFEQEGRKGPLRTPEGAMALLAGAARALVMEEGLGISAGHEDARAFLEWCVEHLEERAAAPARTAEPQS